MNKTPETNPQTDNQNDVDLSKYYSDYTSEEYKRALEEAFEGQGHDNYGGWN